MKHRLIMIVLFGLAAVPCISAAQATAPAASKADAPASAAQEREATGDITSILMHRSGCYGFCPVYEVTVTAQGDVTFDGHRFVEKTGKQHSKVIPSKFQQLAALILHIGFFKLQDRYRYEQDGCTEWWSDSPTVDIIVTRGSTKKHVSYYYGCKGPSVEKPIIALSEAIDKATGTSTWIGNGGRAPPPNSSVKRTREKPRAAYLKR